MVLIQLELSEQANKKLELFKIYKGFEDKRTALNQLLESLDVGTLGDEYFLNKSKRIKQ